MHGSEGRWGSSYRWDTALKEITKGVKELGKDGKTGEMKLLERLLLSGWWPNCQEPGLLVLSLHTLPLTLSGAFKIAEQIILPALCGCFED